MQRIPNLSLKSLFAKIDLVEITSIGQDIQTQLNEVSKGTRFGKWNLNSIPLNSLNVDYQDLESQQQWCYVLNFEELNVQSEFTVFVSLDGQLFIGDTVFNQKKIETAMKELHTSK